MRHRRWEAALMIAHIALYLTAVFLVLPVGMGLAFIAVHQAIFGLYMGASFAPNHKGMPVITADDELDFLRKQVLTSRNVTGGVVRRLPARRPQLPDRAPPVPEHATRATCGGRSRSCGSSAPRSACPTSRPGCSRRTAKRSNISTRWAPPPSRG